MHKFKLEIRGGLLTIRTIKFHLFQEKDLEWKNVTTFQIKFIKVIVRHIVCNSRGQTRCLRS